MKRFNQLTTKQVQSIPSLHFDQPMMAIEAARQGQGAELSRELLTEVEVRDGNLCEPVADRLELPKAYYLVHHRRATLRPAALTLKDWLLSLPRAFKPLGNSLKACNENLGTAQDAHNGTRLASGSSKSTHQYKGPPTCPRNHTTGHPGS
jgi:hypothetical protein